MSQHKFASVERKLLDYIKKKYPLEPLHTNFKSSLRLPSKSMIERQQTEKKLFTILSQLPNWGIGRLFASYNSPPFQGAPSFWRITGVHVDHSVESLDCGVAFGIFHEKGISSGFQQEISEANEQLWRLIPKIDEDHFLNYKPEDFEHFEIPLYVRFPPLLEKMMKSEKMKENSSGGEQPLMKITINRNPFDKYRQRLQDGELV